MKKITIGLILLGLVLAAVCAASADTAAVPAETGTGVTVIHAGEWAAQFPDIYASYMANGEDDEVVEYTEEYPFIKTIYEPYGFATHYGSARGHYYCVQDLLATGRPHPMANCFTCKTADFTAMTLNDGDSAYSVPFESIDPTGFDDVGCFTCHANEPGTTITVTHTYLTAAMGDDFGSVPAETLSCAQCHVEYYFAPDGKMTTLPYTSHASANPDDIYEYYDAMGFSDYTNPRTGVKQIKAQHPEFETFTGAGSFHGGQFNCATCHMERVTNADGQTYLSHRYVTPLTSESVRAAGNCAACHGDLEGFVRGRQEQVMTRVVAIGQKYETLTDRLADAVASGKYTDEELADIRELNRKGQWYWDFVFVENSNGAHNLALATNCLDKAELFADAALLLLDELEK